MREVLFHIEGQSNGSLHLPILSRIVIGRADSDGGAQPSLDLTPYGGATWGVSRVHAVITFEDDTLYLEDLDSTSGTRINGLSLVPNRAYRLRDGDELELGQVRVVVRFSRF
jgi:pSer/pThr/pTyr-binding forkhead associated (FHA) protein